MRCVICLLAACAALTAAEEFSIQIANPVAGQSPGVKTSAFVFRTFGCAKPEMEGSAEGLVGTERRTIPLKLAPPRTGGAFAVFKQWPVEGTWIVNLRGRCENTRAGALVVLGSNGVNREASQLLSHHATETEIGSLLNKFSK